MTDNNTPGVRDIPAPSWTVLDSDTFTDEAGETSFYFIKLGQKHIARLLPEPGSRVDTLGKFVETEYVHVASTHRNFTDKAGSFTYNEAVVTVTDENGKPYEGFLMMAQRHLTLEEIMFSIGEM